MAEAREWDACNSADERSVVIGQYQSVTSREIAEVR